MSRFEGGLTSLFPRSEELIAATRDLERGKRTPAEVEGIYAKGVAEVSALERSLGLSWVTGGHLPRQDLFRPFVESSTGLTSGPLTRWFETNTFFRRPVIEALPKAVPGRLTKNLPQPTSDLAVILPGPWTFLGLSENRSSLDPPIVARAISELLVSAVQELQAAGVRRFLIHEPLAVVVPPSDATERDKFLTLYHPLERAWAPSHTLLWTYFGDGAAALPLLSDLKVNGIGVDLSDTRASDIHSFNPAMSLGLGCLDARTSLPEDPNEIAALAKDLAHRLKPSSLILGPGVPIDLLPYEAAKNKLSVLPQTLRRLREAP